VTDYREINELQRDIARARDLAKFLLMMVEVKWTDWEVTFLTSVIQQVNERLERKDDYPLSTRQVEILVDLRDESVLYERAENFSIKSLVKECFLMQHLLTDDQAEFIRRHASGGTAKLRRRQVKFLFRCARKALVIEPYQGWRESVEDAAV